MKIEVTKDELECIIIGLGCGIHESMLHGEETEKLIRRLKDSVLMTAVASDWDVYTKKPQHIDLSDMENLFKMLSKPNELERDH